MRKPVKIKQTEDFKVFVCSDTHFCHAKPFIYEARGFKTIEEHDETLINNWNNTVRPEDLVIFLGDFMLNGSVEKCKEYFNRLNGEIWTLWGNHESYTYPIYRESLNKYYGFDEQEDVGIDAYPIWWEDKVKFLGYYFEAIIDGVYTVFHHFPYRGWHKILHNSICCTGHEHQQMQETRPEYEYGKILDCGIDYKLRPLAFDEILEIMSKKKTLEQHHGGKK